jgi:hypothetical protein
VVADDGGSDLRKLSRDQDDDPLKNLRIFRILQILHDLREYEHETAFSALAEKFGREATDRDGESPLE